MSLHTTRSPSTASTDEVPTAASQPAAARPKGEASADADWMTAAVVFAILGGCGALWMADLSLVSGGLAAVVSGMAGAFFAEA